MRLCPACEKELTGRVDKIFCSSYCKSAYHYQKNRDSDSNIFKQIDNQLKLNRRLLKEYNKSGKATVRKDVLLKEALESHKTNEFSEVETRQEPRQQP